MSTISNKFFIQVLEDGKSLHGQLLSLGTITQAYKNGQCMPDWSIATSGNDRPLIYLSLLNGSTQTAPDAGYTWKYNGTAITFSSESSTVYIGSTQYTGYASTDGLFFKTTYNSQPALGIIGNLATAANTDIDVITFDGSVTLSTNAVNFSASIDVTITTWTSGGYLGVINMPNGNVITTAGQTLSATGKLYNDNGEVSSGVSYKWFFEGSPSPSPFATTQTATITEASVTDYAVVRCEFWMTIDNVDTMVYSAFVSIDDQQDPEFMWIKTNGNSGNTTSLREGQNVAMQLFVGTADDPTPIQSWNSWKVKLLDSEKTTVADNMTDSTLNNYDSTTGYRTVSSTNGVASFTIYYADVYTACKKGMTGIVVAAQV